MSIQPTELPSSVRGVSVDFAIPANLPPFVALDFETADRGMDSACALGMVRVEDGVIADTFYTLIRPPRRRVYFTELHGITWQMVKDYPDFGQLWPQCAAFLKGAQNLVAHNAPFDRAVLNGSCLHYGLTPPEQPFLCTVKGARKAWKQPHNRLCDVCEYLDIKLDHHHAASDAMAAALIYLHCKTAGVPDDTMRSPAVKK